MADRVTAPVTHPAGRTTLAALLGYGLILVCMTIALFGGAWLAFTVLS